MFYNVYKKIKTKQNHDKRFMLQFGRVFSKLTFYTLSLYKRNKGFTVGGRKFKILKTKMYECGLKKNYTYTYSMHASPGEV